MKGVYCICIGNVQFHLVVLTTIVYIIEIKKHGFFNIMLKSQFIQNFKGEYAMIGQLIEQIKSICNKKTSIQNNDYLIPSYGHKITNGDLLRHCRLLLNYLLLCCK